MDDKCIESLEAGLVFQAPRSFQPAHGFRRGPLVKRGSRRPIICRKSDDFKSPPDKSLDSRARPSFGIMTLTRSLNRRMFLNDFLLEYERVHWSLLTAPGINVLVQSARRRIALRSAHPTICRETGHFKKPFETSGPQAPRWLWRVLTEGPGAYWVNHLP